MNDLAGTDLWTLAVIVALGVAWFWRRRARHRALLTLRQVRRKRGN